MSQALTSSKIRSFLSRPNHLVLVTSMLFNILPFIFIFAFTPYTEGTETSAGGVFSDPNSFDCGELFSDERLPRNWDWRSVADKLNTEECFKTIAANHELYSGQKPAKELFEVARIRKEIVKPELFCVLAPRIARFAIAEDLATLEACKVNRNLYPVPMIATIFKDAGYKLTGTGINPQHVNWGNPFNPSDIDRGTQQRLWLALVAVLHDSLDDVSEERERLFKFLGYITTHHGIGLEAPTPLTELDTQIIRLLPVAIEYVLSRDVAKDFTYTGIGLVGSLYKALHSKIASNRALSLYLHSRFLVNPAVDLDPHSVLGPRGLQLPPIDDEQMTKELFAYGNNLGSILDPIDRELATAARERLGVLLFPSEA